MSARFRFRSHPYDRQLETAIAAVDGERMATMDAIVCPRERGQPGDTGDWQTIDGQTLTVIDTCRRDRQVVPRLAVAPALAPDQPMTQPPTWLRRHAHSRLYTALPLLSMAVSFGVPGGPIGRDQAGLDLDRGDEGIDADDILARLQMRGATEHATPTQRLSEAELDARPDLVQSLPAASPHGIGDVDCRPRGSTHGAAAADIGAVTPASIKNRGAHNRRTTSRMAPGAAS